MDDPAVAAALEHDLMRAGGRLRWIGDGTDRTTWRDVAVIYAAAAPDSALVRATGSDAVWGLQEQLLAAAVDNLAILAWQRTEDGHKGRNRPEPIPRPGITDKNKENGKVTEHFGEAVPIGQVNEMFADMWDFDPAPAKPGPAPTGRRASAVADYLAGGTTYAALAARYDTSPSTIGRWVRAARQQ